MTTVSTTGSSIEQASIKPQRPGCLFYIKRGLLIVLIILVVLPVLGLSYQALATEGDKRAYPAPGQLIDIGGYRLHLHCMGAGSPTVILDAGGGFTSSSWAWVQPEIAQNTRVCAYDRAGWGWSDPSPRGYDAEQNAAELHQLLDKAGLSAPYILVGHSLGGLYDRIYAQQYPDEVAGLVQVDASHPDAWRRLGNREGAGMAPEMLAIGPLAARLGLLRLMDIATPDGELSGHLPDQQEQAMRAFFATAQFAESAQDFDVALPGILAQGRTITSLGDLPLIILTPGYQAALSPDENQILEAMQHELQQLSSNSVYIEVEGANHVSLVHNQENAQATIDAIRLMVETSRRGESLPQ